jgi:hypothetical protein
MRTTITRIILAVLAVATVSAITTPSASAGIDLPSGAGAIPDTVMVSGRHRATGYTGGFFNRERTTVSDTFNGSARFAVGDRPETLAMRDLCAGDFAFSTQAGVSERRDDGAVRVHLIVWTFDECRFAPGTQHGWDDDDAWVAPGESVALTVFARNHDGAAAVSATFTNIWTPKLDVFELMRPFVGFGHLYRLDLGPSRVATSAVATEEPRIAETPKIDTSIVEVTVATVPVPTPQVPADPDADESSASEGIDLTVLVDLGLPTITIPIGSSFDF